MKVVAKSEETVSESYPALYLVKEFNSIFLFLNEKQAVRLNDGVLFEDPRETNVTFQRLIPGSVVNLIQE